MLNSIIDINNFLPFIYAAIFITSLLYFRAFSSLMITSVFFTLLEFSDSIIDPILWKIVQTDVLLFGINMKHEVWAGTWISLNTLVLVLINKSHERLNIAKSNNTQLLCLLLVGVSVFIAIRYINGITIKLEVFSHLYEFALPIINLSMGLFLISALIWNIFDVDIKISLRKLPRG